MIHIYETFSLISLKYSCLSKDDFSPTLSTSICIAFKNILSWCRQFLWMFITSCMECIRHYSSAEASEGSSYTQLSPKDDNYSLFSVVKGKKIFYIWKWLAWETRNPPYVKSANWERGCFLKSVLCYYQSSQKKNVDENS